MDMTEDEKNQLAKKVREVAANTIPKENLLKTKK